MITDIVTVIAANIVADIVAKIDQKRQTLPRFNAFQVELGSTGTRVPAGRRNPQRPSGTRRQSHRQIKVFDRRQLLFRKASYAEFRHYRLPHFLPRYRTWRPRRRP
jgi:hypothetical protein